MVAWFLHWTSPQKIHALGDGVDQFSYHMDDSIKTLIVRKTEMDYRCWFASFLKKWTLRHCRYQFSHKGLIQRIYAWTVKLIEVIFRFHPWFNNCIVPKIKKCFNSQKINTLELIFLRAYVLDFLNEKYNPKNFTVDKVSLEKILVAVSAPNSWLSAIAKKGNCYWIITMFEFMFLPNCLFESLHYGDNRKLKICVKGFGWNRFFLTFDSISWCSENGKFFRCRIRSISDIENLFNYMFATSKEALLRKHFFMEEDLLWEKVILVLASEIWTINASSIIFSWN